MIEEKTLIQKGERIIKIVVGALGGTFIIILSLIFLPAISGFSIDGFRIFLLFFLIFFFLGLILLIFTLKREKEGRRKKFLILTSLSTLGFFIATLLHNAFYALTLASQGIFLLNYLLKVFHTFFLLVALLLCPIGFLISLGGSIILLIKK